MRRHARPCRWRGRAPRSPLRSRQGVRRLATAVSIVRGQRRPPRAFAARAASRRWRTHGGKARALPRRHVCPRCPRVPRIRGAVLCYNRWARLAAAAGAADAWPSHPPAAAPPAGAETGRPVPLGGGNEATSVASKGSAAKDRVRCRGTDRKACGTTGRSWRGAAEDGVRRTPPTVSPAGSRGVRRTRRRARGSGSRPVRPTASTAARGDRRSVPGNRRRRRPGP